MNPIQQIIEERFLSAKARSPHFSLRALAKKLGLSSGALSEILKGKRKVSPKLAKRLADKLDLSPSERKSIGLSHAAKEEAEFQLSDDAFYLISDWWHFAILNLTQTQGFRSSHGWIAARLGLPANRVSEAIARLQRLGLLTIDKKGQMVRTHARLKTSDDVTNFAVQRSHRVDLELADQTLDEVPVTLRDITSATMTLDPRMLPRLKALIRTFEDELMEEAESVKGTEVYRLSIQLFPLTQPKRGNT